MNVISLNTSYKQHSVLGLIIGIWLVAFLVLIAPFDVADLPLKIRLELMPPYAPLVFMGYMLGVLFQNLLFKNIGTWNVYLESLIIITANVFMALLCYPYYKSDWVNGEFNFWGFIKIVYSPIALIVSGIIVFGRAYLNKLQAKRVGAKIMLKGDNKADVLHIDPNSIIAINSSQNYIEIFYMLNGQVKKQLLRTTLKEIHKQANFLTQVHRSSLVNLSHFTSWKSTNTILLQDLEILVSKKYVEELREKIKFIP